MIDGRGLLGAGADFSPGLGIGGPFGFFIHTSLYPHRIM